MKNVSSNSSLLVTEDGKDSPAQSNQGRMNKKVDIIFAQSNPELFRVELAEPIQVRIEGEHFIARWDELKWAEVRLLASAQAKLAIKMLNMSEEDVLLERFERISGSQAQIGIRVSFVNLDQTLNNETRAILNSAIQYFLEEIHSGRQLFDKPASFLDERTGQTAKEATNDFLVANGGKKITAPLKIVFDGNQIDCAGAYNVKPPAPPATATRKEVIGLVDEIRFSNKSITVIASDDTHQIYFDPHYFFERLVEIFRRQQTHIFGVIDLADAKGKRMLTLADIGEEVLTERVLV